MRGWISGVAFVATFVGLGAGLGLWLLGVPLPLTLGLLAGLLNVVPFAGSVLGGALATLVAFTISPLKALEVAVLFVVLNQIEGNILQPQVMGRRVRISTAVVIVSFLVLGTLIGPIIGAFLAVPATVVVSVVLDELAEKRPSLGYEEEESATRVSKADR
jgi:predicted PurR-regulated permease PerM